MLCRPSTRFDKEGSQTSHEKRLFFGTEYFKILFGLFLHVNNYKTYLVLKMLQITAFSYIVRAAVCSPCFLLNKFFLFGFCPCLPSPPAHLPGASAAGERGAAEDGVRRREGRGHRVPRARGDAVLEGAADALRGLPGADHHGDGQAQVLRHGAGSDHVDGLGHLSDRDRGEAQVSAAVPVYLQLVLDKDVCSISDTETLVFSGKLHRLDEIYVDMM